MSALAAIHVGIKQLGIAEEDARDLYERQTGQRSLRAMSPSQHEAVIGELRRLGFKGHSKGVSKRLTGPYAKKLQALWIAAWNLGIVRDRTDAAMLAFVKRQTGIEHTRFLRYPDDGRKAVEALKAWIGRDGGVSWGTSAGYDWLKTDGGKIAWAQFGKLLPGATLIGNRAEFHRLAMQILGRDILAGLGSLSPADWRVVMNALGERVRKGKAGA